MKLKINRSNLLFSLLAIALSLAILFTLRPYFTWENEGAWGRLTVLIIVLCFTVIAYMRLFKRVIDDFSILFILFYSFFVISTEVPFRQHDSSLSLGVLIVTLTPFLLVFARKELTEKLYKYLYWLFVLICTLSLLNLALYSFGLASPYKRVFLERATFYTSGFDYYTLAPVLSNQYIDLGIKLYRNNGWFYEPGHFACYIALMLVLQKNPFKGVANKTMLLALLSTLSGVGFLFLALLILFHTVKRPRYLLTFSIIIIILFFFIQFSDELSFIFEKFVLSKFAGAETLDHRRNFNGPGLFELPISALLIGYGGEYINSNNWQLSDFTHHIYSYGLLSFIPYGFFISTFFIYGLKNKKYNFLYFLLFFIIIYAHRHFIAFRVLPMSLIYVAYVVSGLKDKPKSV